MDLLLVQPPFVQLNSPYPAVAYLASYARREGHTARCLDLSIELFRSIFCAAGLAAIFAEAEKRLAGRLDALDRPTRKNVQRYLSNAERYVQTIDRIIGFLAGGDDAFAHELSAGRRVPWGHRSEGFLAANDGEIGAPDAPLLASLIVEDLADFITFAVDPDFSLVRYAASKASSQPDFRVVEKAARESYLLGAFFRPLAEKTLRAVHPPAPRLLCVTVPFPGTLPGALVLAEEARKVFGREVKIAFGGGYVSTELRAMREGAIFGYADYLCYDAGYGALSSIIASLAGGRTNLYRTVTAREGGLTAHGFDGEDLAFFRSEGIYEVRETEDAAAVQGRELVAIREVFPDYSELKFSRYVRIVEGTNPMHALWSDAKWIKARLAYGCYWKKCAFCDTALDYIARFAPASPEALFAHLLKQSALTRQKGIHFIDEAMPVPHLVRFALQNIRGGRPFSFWGNTRLETQFTADACALLAEGGLVGISAGLEIATEEGLRVTGKGLLLTDVVGALAALKGNGIMVHLYLIYGWPGQSAQEIVDAMEVVRQLFVEGLVDSAFWHKFILTRHSPLYAAWKAGERKELRVIERPWTFGSNDLSFEGEEELGLYGPGLDAAMDAWMEGEGREEPVSRWFDFRLRRPSVAPDHVAHMTRAAQRSLSAPAPAAGKNVAWLGGRLLPEPTENGGIRLSWSYRNRVEHIELPTEPARRLMKAVAEAATMGEFLSLTGSVGDEPFAETKAFRTLRQRGLAAY